MAELPALPRPEYGRNEMMVLDNNVLVGEIVDAIADNQQMVPGFEEFMNTMQSISNSLNEISIGLSEMSSRFTQMFDNILVAEEIKPEQSDTSDKDKLFTTLETLVAVSFLTLEAIRALPDSFGRTVEKDQKAEEKFGKKDALSLKEKELESSNKKTTSNLVSSISKGTDGFLKNLLLLLGALFIGFFAAGGSLSGLLSSVFDFVVKQITDLFSSLFTAIKDAFIGFVINPIISVLNTIPGVDIEPLMTTEEQARAAGQNTTGTDQIGSTFTERLTAKGLIKGATLVGGGAVLGMEAVDRAKGLFGKQTAETVGKEAAETAGEQTAKTAAKKAGKFGLKSALKKIPLLGLGFGAAFAAQRALEGDYAGAGLELASGAAGAIPGIGTGTSLAIDAGLFATDTAGITGPAMVQNRNDLAATPSAALLKNNLDMARQGTEEVRLRPQQQMGGNVHSVVVGGTSVNNARTEIIQPPPEAGTDMGIAKKVR
jgi:hypothetical protein